MLQVRASTASWIASLPLVEFSAIVCADSSMFLAFFESQDDNKAAAAYAIASVHQVCFIVINDYLLLLCVQLIMTMSQNSS